MKVNKDYSEQFPTLAGLRELGEQLPDKDIMWAVDMLEKAYDVMVRLCSDPHMDTLQSKWLREFNESQNQK